MMMNVKIKYVGTGETGLTSDKIYDVIQFTSGSGSAIIINDNGNLYTTSGVITSPTEWELVSVEKFDVTQLVS